MRKVEFVIRREWEPGTFAIITATVDPGLFKKAHPKDGTAAGAIKAMVTQAVTAWVNETEEGKNAAKFVNWNFNAGDLADALDKTGLRERLKVAGVMEIAIQSSEIAYDDGWGLDDTLFDSCCEKVG